MEDNRKDPASMVDSWLDDILEKNAVNNEISPDEGAVAAAGLTHPDDMELERIVQETMAENWGEEENTHNDASGKADSTRFFSADQLEAAQQEAPADAPEDAPEDTPEEEGAERKVRPKAKKGYGLLGIPHLAATVIWGLIILFIGTTLGRTLWLCAADLLALGKTGKEVTVMIEVDDRLPDIAEKLKEAGMIRYPGLFEAFAKLTGKGDGILIGSITFNPETVYDYNALINAMSFRGGSTIVVEVMIPEGYSCAQIFALLEKEGVCSAKDLEEYAASGELNDYWFLRDVPRGHKYCLEGFLFPDTYQFYMEDEPRRVLEKFLDDFDYRFTLRMKEKIASLNQKLGYVRMEMRDIITMASIIEKEKATGPEGYTISSVFYNRLTHASTYPFLNSDATILYYTQYYRGGETLSEAEINASPYNTYTTKGLPAGPICNPGLASLDAALDPENTNYYFFVYDKNAGVHRFSRNLSEHTEWVNKLGLS